MIIINRLKEQINTSKSLSDSETFISLLRLGEFITKIVTISTISALKENNQKIQYRFSYTIVSADGIGTWAQVIDQILGTAVSINIITEFSPEKNELLQPQKKEDWGYDAIHNLYKCKSHISGKPYEYNVRLKLKDWFKLFTEIRNDYAHNRIAATDYSYLIPLLEASLSSLLSNFSLFKRKWIYAHKTNNGSWKFINLSTIETEKNENSSNNFSKFNKEGIYVLLDNNTPLFLDLLFTDISLNDFYLPNGRFTDKKFELISYISSQTRDSISDNYLLPLEQLPKSETHGLEQLELIDSTFTNLPKLNRTYIERNEIEEKLTAALLDAKKWRIVTLRGRGGIGKTSTALQVLRKITKEGRYDAILWFSARDIDFDEFGGPINVQPRILTKEDISKEFLNLIEHPQVKDKSFDKNDYFTKQLENNFFGKTLLVFDNFETVERPIEIYEWLENFIVLPNKILITTRHREFSTDKPIEVEGMNFDEFNKLVTAVSIDLNIESIINEKTILQLYKISQGHPYVVKILMGDIANTKSINNLSHVFENKDQILQALFERTYDGLKPLSQKIFQILCNWRSVIPEISLEAIVICYPIDTEEIFDFDVKDAIDELRMFSFIEILNPKDDFRFINVPLTASFFGLTKLKANPNKSLIQAYTKKLQEFGASQVIHINEGIEPRIKYFFSSIKQKVSTLSDFNENYLNIIQFLCRRYSKSWLLLADIYDSNFKLREKVKKCYKEYLRAANNDEEKERHWDKLAQLYFQDGKIDHYFQTLIDKYDYNNCALSKLTNLAKEISINIRNKRFANVNREIRNEMLKRLISLITENNEFHKIKPSQTANLAWLYIHIGQAEIAKKLVDKALLIERNNNACIEIKKSLTKR